LQPVACYCVILIEKNVTDMMKSLLTFFMLVLLLASCSAERKMANKLARDTSRIAVLLITTEEIYADQMTDPDGKTWIHICRIR
jgi:type III secretory pathway lipoprotein EscJ